MDQLMPLGMVSELPSEIQSSDGSVAEAPKDYFVVRDGQVFAGMHLLVDLWDAHDLCDPAHIDAYLKRAALAAGATILHSHFHHFSPNGGVSGVLVLAESHISIHTWPERNFAAVDIFMCGECDPHKSVPMLRAAFTPGRVDLTRHAAALSARHYILQHLSRDGPEPTVPARAHAWPTICGFTNRCIPIGASALR